MRDRDAIAPHPGFQTAALQDKRGCQAVEIRIVGLLAMKILLTSLFSIATLGTLYAQNDVSTPLAGQENNPRAATNYVDVADDDEAMVSAMENARKSLAFFIAALRAEKPEDSEFEIKKAFVDGDNAEHLWISDVAFDGKNFKGTINNKPVEVQSVKLGQRVTVTPEEVSDWMFVKDGKLVGGYTTRVFYARLSASEKARFDRETEFKIE